jgi:polysaccharide deacetylase 2 family uncharacterized protein YibQ
MSTRPAALQYILALWLAHFSAAAVADKVTLDNSGTGLPGIALIIDDLGNQGKQGRHVVRLPGPVACAFLPHAPFTATLARQAHLLNKEVMLHLPMQADNHEHALKEIGVLTFEMTQHQFLATLQENLGAVPHVSGINNHMGSLLTRHHGQMTWLMQSISEQGSLFFVDSRTTDETVAGSTAHSYGVPSVERNIFLDNDPEPEAIRAQFQRLLDIARRQGTALGIGHPHAATLEVLRDEIGKLESQGVELIPVARLIELQNTRNRSWYTFLSR